jgi:hypothetical protein
MRQKTFKNGRALFAQYKFQPIEGSSMKVNKWKRINRKQNARWQHLSRLKARAFLLEYFL